MLFVKDEKRATKCLISVLKKNATNLILQMNDFKKSFHLKTTRLIFNIFILVFEKNSLTCVLCNRQPFSKNGIFPNLIDQKTKKMHF